ncbi:MAG: nucleotidyltransferase family protein [Cyanobacteria bacterium P01_F01_bin.53]
MSTLLETHSQMRPFTEKSLGTKATLEWLWSYPAHAKLVPHAISIAETRHELLPSKLEEKSKHLRKCLLMKSLLLSATNDKLLGAMKKASIKAIPLKGPILANRLYGGLHHRPFGDIDILVEPAQLGKAKKLLLKAGFIEVTRNPRLFHLEFTRPHGSGTHLHLELHRRLIGYAIGGDHLAFGIAGSKGFSEWCWERANSEEDHWQLKEEDELLYLCLHLAKHLIMERKTYSSGHSCSSLLLARDIQLALTRWKFDREEFLATIARFHLEVPVSLALAFTFRWFAIAEPTLEALAERVTPRQSRRFLNWADDARADSRETAEDVGDRLQMVIEAFAMCDRWSDRLKILPMVASEFMYRSWANAIPRKAED